MRQVLYRCATTAAIKLRRMRFQVSFGLMNFLHGTPNFISAFMFLLTRPQVLEIFSPIWLKAVALGLGMAQNFHLYVSLRYLLSTDGLFS